MTIFDYVVLAILGLSLLLGIWRGLVSEILSLAAWIIAFLAAKYFAPQFAPVFSGWIKDPTLQLMAAFAVIVLVVVLLSALLRLLLQELLKAVGLSLADRFLGACFGLIRGLLIVLVLVVAAGLTSVPRQIWWQQALLAPPLETAVIAAKPWLPAGLAKRIRYR